jgi:hypothetical protein
MTNPTFMWHVTMAVHEDRVSALQRSRLDRSRARPNPVHRRLGLAQRLMRSLQIRPVRVAL